MTAPAPCPCSVFHVKQRSGSRSMSSCCGAGRRSRTSSAPAPLPRSGRGTSPTRPSSCRSRPRRGSGSTSARAPAFPGSWSRSCCASGRAMRVHLVESNQRKCAFLREVARETGAPATVHAGRIEDVLPVVLGRRRALGPGARAPAPAFAVGKKTHRCGNDWAVPQRRGIRDRIG